MTVPASSNSTDNEHTSTTPAVAASAVSPAAPPASPPATHSTSVREATPAVSADAAHADDKPPAEADEPEGDVIDMETFDQILDLDEDDTHEFSRGMAWAYFSQAASTFEEMDEAYTAKDLPKLSSLGHFLKGSSAALGVFKVQASCERVQHYGDKRDEEANRDLTAEEALAKIEVTLKRVKVEYAAAEKWLKNYYEKLGPDAAAPA